MRARHFPSNNCEFRCSYQVINSRSADSEYIGNDDAYFEAAIISQITVNNGKLFVDRRKSKWTSYWKSTSNRRWITQDKENTEVPTKMSTSLEHTSFTFDLLTKRLTFVAFY
jgi:hypothetical protein